MIVWHCNICAKPMFKYMNEGAPAAGDTMESRDWRYMDDAVIEPQTKIRCPECNHDDLQPETAFLREHTDDGKILLVEEPEEV